MRRVIVLGPGGSGKSTLALRLGQIIKLRVIELDKVFWQRSLVSLPREEWVRIQQSLTAEDGWILDGDLGSYDAVEIRLQAADTIIFLDFSFIRCAWRAILRSRERADFWLWLLRYRQKSRPFLMEAVARYAPNAALHVLHTPKELNGFLAFVARSQPKQTDTPT